MHQPRPQIASPGRGRFAGTPGGVSGAEGYAGWGPRGPELAIQVRFLTYCQELGAGVLGQIKYHALPAAFGLTELHRGTVSGPALCRAVLGVQDNQHRQTGASRKGSGSHLAASAGCRLVLVGWVPRGQVALVIRGVLRAFGPRGCKWAQTIAGPPRFPLHPV